jgi:hypothetical protein
MNKINCIRFLTHSVGATSALLDIVLAWMGEREITLGVFKNTGLTQIFQYD